MKAPIGVDSHSKSIHSVVATAANVLDSVIIGDLLHSEETRAWGDSAYAGKKSALHTVVPHTKDFTNKKGRCYRRLTDQERSANRDTSKSRARVEPLFGILKGRFGFTKVRDKGLAKYAHRLFVSSTLTHIADNRY